MRAIRFLPEHVDELKDHGGQEYLVPMVSREDIGNLTAQGSHLSFFADDLLVGCAGVVPVHQWRGIAWALLRTGVPQHFLGMHRLLSRALDAETYQRIEAYVDPTFLPAIRWMRLLGFRPETPYKSFYFPDGRGASEWVRYKD